MNLNEIEWDEFKISDIFPKIEYGKNSYAIDLEDGHDCIYVGAKKDDNGFMKWCKRDETLISKGNCVVFIVDGKGSVGYCNYMDRDFIATANLKLGYCKELNQYTGLFIATIASKERFRYSFGRKWKKFVKDTIIKLPALVDNTGKVKPDWNFMEAYIKSLHYKPLTTKNKSVELSKIAISDWKDFKISDLFNVELSKGDLKVTEVEKGDIPLISSGETNNGVVGFIDKEGDGKAEIYKGNCLTVDMFCNAFYQHNEFYAVSHGRVNILKPKYYFNKYIGLFISTIINNEKFKYSYGRAVYKSVCEEMVIKLPSITREDGSYEPNWDYMENYIKSLPYGDRI